MLRHEKIIIGGSLASLLYGYLNNIPIIYTVPRVPLFFEVDKKANSKSQVWKELSFKLSLAGLMPMSNLTTNIRLDGATLKAFTDGSAFGEFEVDDLVVFDDTNLEGWHGKVEKKEKMMVLDWINDRGSSPHELEYISGDDDFVKHVYFYMSERIFGNSKKKKDILSVSYMNKSQIHDPGYTDSYVRFKVLDLMTESGIQGIKNGINKKTGKEKRLSIKLETTDREVIPVFKEPYSEEDLLEEYYSRESKNKYVNLLSKYLDGQG